MLPPFRKIWCIDFEFVVSPDELPRPNCMAGHEILSGQEIRLWEHEWSATAPFSLDADTLVVAHYASAEIGCFLQLGWPDPARLLDTFCGFRCLTNTTATPLPAAGLVSALLHFGLDTIGADAKDANRDLIMSGGPWSDEEKERILHYCASDVHGTVKLFQKLLPISIGRAPCFAVDIWLPLPKWSGKVFR